MPVDPTRLDKFTQRAREAVRMAERDCARLGGGPLTCEAMLSALLSQGQNASHVVLARLSADTAALKAEMASLAAESCDAEAPAEETGWSQAAARAIGQALSKNPVPIIVPCHRVIKSDGSLGGFSAGLKLKELLLNLETTK